MTAKIDQAPLQVFDTVVKAVDTDGSGEIDQDEFVMAMKMSDLRKHSKSSLLKHSHHFRRS